MTPEEWFAAIDPEALLGVVDPQPVQINGVWQAPPPRPSPVYRRLRLFATACARMVWHILSNNARDVILISEEYAEGRATEGDQRVAFTQTTYGARTAMQHAVNAAAYCVNRTGFPDEPEEGRGVDYRAAARAAAFALARQRAGRAPARRSDAALWHAVWMESFVATRAVQAALVRDIFPPPGYSPRIEPEWRTSTVVAMARQMDETGDYSAVSILADALEDAGCEAEPVLQCCRAPQVHTCGNWVVDLVLERL